MGQSLLDRYLAAGRDAKKRGDREAYEAAKTAYRHTKASVAQRKSAYEKSDAEDYDPNSGTSKGRQFLEGIGSGMQNVGLRAGRMLTPEAREGGLTKRIDQQTDIDNQMSGLQKGGKFVGEMVATAPIGGGVGAGARAGFQALKGGRSLGMLTKSLANAAEGAAGGQMTVDDGAGTGAAFGAAMLPAMRALGATGKVLGMGVKRTKDSNTLINHGAELDIGQMNPGGWADRFIKAAENAPGGIGHGIRGGREDILRPVIPNLVSDMAKQARSPNAGRMSAREGIDRALTSVEQKFDVVDKVGLAPDDAASLAAGRAGGKKAQRGALQGELDARAEKRMALSNAEEGIEARRLLNRDARRRAARRKAHPDVRQALDLKKGVIDSELGQAQINRGRYSPKLSDLKEKGREGFADYRSDLQRGLLNSSRSRYLPPADRSKIEKSLGEQLAKLQAKDLSPTELKSMASRLKTDARKYKDTASPNEDTRRLSISYNRAAQYLEHRIEKALAAGGEDVGKYKEANKQFGALQPFEEAVFQTGATSHGLINPTILENALKNQLGPKKWRQGTGGAPRDTTEALKRLEMSQFEGAGSLQSSSLPSTILRAIQGTVGIPLSSKTVGAIARGDHALGGALRNLSPKKKRLVKTLAAMYHGVPGAAASDE